MATSDSIPAPVGEPPYPQPLYAWYTVGVLTIVYMFSFIDRQILNLLVEEIKTTLQITDTQVGLLGAFAFALFYTTFGIPLGRLADSRSRRTIIALGFVFWSLMTAGCGLANDFLTLLLFRIGVGVGEAALSPAAYSLITDSFPSNRRATAISVYSMGIYIGSGLALIVGARVSSLVSGQPKWDLPLVGEVHSWQVIFFIVGLPGVVLALLLYTIGEPVRRGQVGKGGTPLPEVYRYIRANWATFLCHTVGFAFLSFSSYGMSFWVPTWFRRNFGWTKEQIGDAYGLIIAVFGTLGIVAAGRFADWLAERGRRDATMLVGLIVSLLWFPGGILLFLVPDPRWALLFLALGSFLGSAPFGVAPAAIQQMMPNAMRAQAGAIYLFVVNLIGLGLGPTAVGWMTTNVFGRDNAVHWSLLAMTVAAHVISSVLLWLGLAPFRRSLDYLTVWLAAQSEPPPNPPRGEDHAEAFYRKQ